MDDTKVTKKVVTDSKDGAPKGESQTDKEKRLDNDNNPHVDRARAEGRKN